METLNIKVFEKGATYRKGHLYHAGRLLFTTLEPTDRGITGTDDYSKVVINNYKGKVAIPYGTYDVVVAWSNANKKMVPHLLNVPGFSEIEIHPGNSSADTLGCILVGVTDSKGEDWISHSQTAFTMLMNLIKSFGSNEVQVVIDDSECK